MGSKTLYKKLKRRYLDKISKAMVYKELNDDLSDEVKEKIHHEIDKVFRNNYKEELNNGKI